MPKYCRPDEWDPIIIHRPKALRNYSYIGVVARYYPEDSQPHIFQNFIIYYYRYSADEYNAHKRMEHNVKITVKAIKAILHIP